jgi:LytS/YehU family sensor histidine kinase
LQQQKTELEMQALRAQMNPHFIFNSLNAINHFILKNETETASDYLTKFSRLIRLVLQNSAKKNIPLIDELETLRLYIDLERVRFKKHFDYSIQCDESLDTESITVPPLILQPFAENAIWHGLMHKKEGGELLVTVTQEDEMLCCTIMDNGIGRVKAAALKSKSASYKKSMGIQITEARLQMLHGGNKGRELFRITDLKNEAGEGCGTKVFITIPVAVSEKVSA